MEELKEKIFFKCLCELEKTQLIGIDSKHTDAEYELQASKFKGLFELIDEVGLSDEYEEWRQNNKTKVEVEG